MNHEHLYVSRFGPVRKGGLFRRDVVSQHDSVDGGRCRGRSAGKKTPWEREGRPRVERHALYIFGIVPMASKAYGLSVLMPVSHSAMFFGFSTSQAPMTAIRSIEGEPLPTVPWRAKSPRTWFPSVGRHKDFAQGSVTLLTEPGIVDPILGRPNQRTPVDQFLDPQISSSAGATS